MNFETKQPDLTCQQIAAGEKSNGLNHEAHLTCKLEDQNHESVIAFIQCPRPLKLILSTDQGKPLHVVMEGIIFQSWLR